MAEPILPEAPIMAMVCFVFTYFIFLIVQSYLHKMPSSIVFGQEKALTFVNEMGSGE
jgi:hypothetical protein